MLVEAGHLGGNAPKGDRLSIETALWKWLRYKYDLWTVLDLGCGIGNSLRIFERIGYLPIGLEGLYENCQKCTSHPVVCWDITNGPLRITGIDLVWCAEVVEHIEPKHVSSLVDMLCVGRVIAMTHALPGQQGYHHVNCQDKKYWVDAIAGRGYSLVDESQYRGFVRNRYFKNSGLVFERNK